MNPEKLFPAFLDLSLKSALVILAAFLASLAFRRASAANRHVIWLTLLTTLLLLPFTGLAHPQWSIFWQPSVQRSPSLAPLSLVVPKLELPALSSQAVTASKPQPSRATPVRWSAFGVMVWFSGAALLLLNRGWSSWKLRRFVQSSPQISNARLLELARESGREIAARWELRESALSRAPLVFGIWRPVILMPAEARAWSDEELRAALLHEFAHVRRRDCLTRSLMDIACAIYWVNPLVWIASRKMRIAQEQACDDIVLSAGISPTGYASQMVEIVRNLASERFSSRRALAMAQPSTLETRIRAIVDADCDRRPLSRSAFAGGTLAILAALALCGAARLRGADGKGAAANPPQTQSKAVGTSTSDKAPGAPATPPPVAKPTIARNPEEDQILAMVNDRPITALDVTRAVPRAADRSSPEARKEALEKLIDNALLVQYFRTMRYEIPSYFVDERVKTIVKEEFNGDEVRFEAVLAEQGFTVEKFKTMEEEQIINQEMRRLFAKNANATTPDERKKAIADWLAALRAKAVVTYH